MTSIKFCTNIYATERSVTLHPDTRKGNLHYPLSNTDETGSLMPSLLGHIEGSDSVFFDMKTEQVTFVNVKL